jgi:hypothetical protein
MTKLIDGPGAGKALMLRRVVTLLRVTVNEAGEIDALDQPEDAPKPEEEWIYVYVNTGQNGGTCHVRYGGNKRHLSGFYAVAEYRLYDLQPPDVTMRDNAKWRAWCETQRERVGLPPA